MERHDAEVRGLPDHPEGGRAIELGGGLGIRSEVAVAAAEVALPGRDQDRGQGGREGAAPPRRLLVARDQVRFRIEAPPAGRGRGRGLEEGADLREGRGREGVGPAGGKPVDGPHHLRQGGDSRLTVQEA